VKRPRLAPSLQGPPPDYQLKGSSTRFDIYLTA
jgi:Putative SAM-dependent methyltransferase